MCKCLFFRHFFKHCSGIYVAALQCQFSVLYSDWHLQVRVPASSGGGSRPLPPLLIPVSPRTPGCLQENTYSWLLRCNISDSCYILTVSTPWQLLYPDSWYSLTVAISYQLLLPDSYNFPTVGTSWQLLYPDSYYFLKVAISWLPDGNYILTVTTTWQLLYPDSYYYLTVAFLWQLLLLDSYNFLTVTTPWQLLFHDSQ